MAELQVGGVVRRRGRLALLVLDERLDEHDSFLHAELDLDPDGVRLRVRVHTFDDATVLSAAGDEQISGDAWTGRLRFQRSRRAAPVPTDLARALTAAGLPPDLSPLDQRERRHLLGYLADAATPTVRRGRVAAIVSGLRDRSA